MLRYDTRFQQQTHNFLHHHHHRKTLFQLWKALINSVRVLKQFTDYKELTLGETRQNENPETWIRVTKYTKKILQGNEHDDCSIYQKFP